MAPGSRTFLIIGAAVVAMTAAFAFWPHAAPPAAGVQPSVQPLAPATAAASAATVAGPVPAVPASAPLAMAVPPGVTPAQWAALAHELKDRPAELARLSGYFAFQAAAARLRDGRAEGATPARVALAREIDAGLDERLARAELSGGEARLLKMAVLEVLVDSEAERQAALQRWQQQPRAVPAGEAARRTAEAGFQRQQAEIVAAWNAQPAAQRDARALEQQLDALRRARFAPASAPSQ